MSEFEAWLRELESERPDHPRQVAVMRAHERKARAFWEAERLFADDAEHRAAWWRAVRLRDRIRLVDPVVEAAVAAYSARKRAGREGAPVGQEAGGK